LIQEKYQTVLRNVLNKKTQNLKEVKDDNVCIHLKRDLSENILQKNGKHARIGKTFQDVTNLTIERQILFLN
jgi:hypothetical protein